MRSLWVRARTRPGTGPLSTRHHLRCLRRNGGAARRVPAHPRGDKPSIPPCFISLYRLFSFSLHLQSPTAARSVFLSWCVCAWRPMAEQDLRNVNDPSAGSPTETLLRLLLPLNDQVWSSSRQHRQCRDIAAHQSEDLTKSFNR